MENQMTIDQVLKITVEMLEGLKVPVKLMNDIGIPVAGAIGNIRMCIEAYEASRAEAEKKRAEAESEQAEEQDDGNADAE